MESVHKICTSSMKVYIKLYYRIVGFSRYINSVNFEDIDHSWNLTPRKNELPIAVLNFCRPIRGNKIAKKLKIAHSRNLSTSKKTNYSVTNSWFLITCFLRLVSTAICDIWVLAFLWSKVSKCYIIWYVTLSHLRSKGFLFLVLQIWCSTCCLFCGMQ